jgi:hypothetical protein
MRNSVVLAAAGFEALSPASLCERQVLVAKENRAKRTVGTRTSVIAARSLVGGFARR